MCSTLLQAFVLKSTRKHFEHSNWFYFQAQAQECILEKSMTDNRKSSITAKVSAQIVDYYKLAMKSLDASNTSMYIGSKKTKVMSVEFETFNVYKA